jgi:hypothetical protein
VGCARQQAIDAVAREAADKKRELSAIDDVAFADLGERRHPPDLAAAARHKRLSFP